jgi:EAL domain-containing protein (putative c-di-GMP-specific phosphodiesterase class I)
MDPNLKIVIDKLYGLTKRLDDCESHWEQRFTGLERSLSARDEFVDRRFVELEALCAAPVEPAIAKCLAALESAYVDNTAAFAKRLEAIESNRVVISNDDCEARVTALETVVAYVNAMVDDLCTQVQKVS